MYLSGAYDTRAVQLTMQRLIGAGVEGGAGGGEGGEEGDPYRLLINWALQVGRERLVVVSGGTCSARRVRSVQCCWYRHPARFHTSQCTLTRAKTNQTRRHRRQERASHTLYTNAARLAGYHGAPALSEILTAVAGDLARRQGLLTGLTGALFDLDPDHALVALGAVAAEGLVMPGAWMDDGWHGRAAGDGGGGAGDGGGGSGDEEGEGGGVGGGEGAASGGDAGRRSPQASSGTTTTTSSSSSSNSSSSSSGSSGSSTALYRDWAAAADALGVLTVADYAAGLDYVMDACKVRGGATYIRCRDWSRFASGWGASGWCNFAVLNLMIPKQIADPPSFLPSPVLDQPTPRQQLDRCASCARGPRPPPPPRPRWRRCRLASAGWASCSLSGGCGTGGAAPSAAPRFRGSTSGRCRCADGGDYDINVTCLSDAAHTQYRPITPTPLAVMRGEDRAQRLRQGLSQHGSSCPQRSEKRGTLQRMVPGGGCFDIDLANAPFIFSSVIQLRYVGSTVRHSFFHLDIRPATD